MSSAGLQRNNRRRNFQVFYNKKRPEIARKYPFLGAKQIQRKVEELWRRLDPKEKEKFCVVASPVGVGNFRRQPGEAWQEEEPVQDDGTLSPRTGDLERLSGGSYRTPLTAGDVVPTSDDDEAQQPEMDEHHIFTKSGIRKTGIWLAGSVLTSNTTKKKKLLGLPSLSSGADSDDNYVLRKTGNRTHSTMRSRGLLTLHMARMQMVATTSEGIGQVEFTRTSNSESEGISCDSWFDQDVLTEQLPDNKHSHTDEDTETSNILTTLSENKTKTPPLKMKMSAKDFDIENSSLKGKMAEEESTRYEVNNVESNEDEEEYTLSQASKRAITQYLSCSGLNGTFNTSTSDDENQDGETKFLIESAIDSLESDLLSDSKFFGTDENGQWKVSVENPLLVHERVCSILSEIINDVLNTDPETHIYSKATEYWLHGGKENVSGHDYDAGDDRSRPAHLTDRSLQTSDENRDSGSELWDRLFMRKTRRYTRKRSFSCSESGELSAEEMGMVGHPEVWKETGYETTDMGDTSSIMHNINAHSSDTENTYRAQQYARQDTSAPSPELKFIPSSIVEEVKTEDNKSNEDGAFLGTDHAHQFTPSPSAREQHNLSTMDEKPATSSAPHHMVQEGKDSTSGKVTLDPLKELKPNVHMAPASLHVLTECKVPAKEEKVTKNPSNNTDSAKPKSQVIKRGTPRPAQNTMARLLTRDYNMTTRAQSAAGKRNTRSRVLDYRQLSGLQDKEQKTPSRTCWKRTDSKDSILSCDSGRSVRVPRQRGKKRKRHQSTSSVGSDFSTTSSVPESLEDDQWEDIPTEGNELNKNTENEVRDSMEAEYFPIQQHSEVTPVTVYQHPPQSADLDGEVDEKVVKSSQVTQTSESKEAADPNRELEIQADDTEHSGQEFSLKQQEDHCNVETVPNSSGGFLCELFSDPKPNTGTWLPGFNRSIPHHPESAPVSFEEDEIFL